MKTIMLFSSVRRLVFLFACWALCFGSLHSLVWAQQSLALPLGATGSSTDTSTPVVVNLPAPVEDVVVGQSGQLLILWLKNVQKLAVFDVKAKRIVKYLSVASDDVKFAANATKLVVVLNDQSLMQRWDLQTFERELTVAAPEGGPVHSMAMGYASSGPLLIVNGSTSFFHPVTLARLDVDMEFSHFYAWGSDLRDQLQLRASGDGTTFSAWRAGTSYGVIMALRVQGRSTKLTATTGLHAYLTPNFDGSLFYSNGEVLNSELKVKDPSRYREQAVVPFYGGSFFIALTDKDGSKPGFRGDRNNNKLTPVLYSEADQRLLLTLPELSEMNWSGFPRSGFGLDKRFYVLPNEQTLITIPDSKDRLVLRPFNLVEVLDKSTIDYLFVSSRPSPTAQVGQKYLYQLDVKSKRGKVQYSLESGAPGMTLSKTGKLQWTVPAENSGKEEVIIITVSDASGQQIYHTFKIAVAPLTPGGNTPLPKGNPRIQV